MGKEILIDKYLGEAKKKPMKLSKCCNAKVVFNNATGDYVCSSCRNPVGRGGTYMKEGGSRGMSVEGLASHIKKKYGKTVKSNVLMRLMAEEGLHGDDDYPDMEDALRAVGVKVK